MLLLIIYTIAQTFLTTFTMGIWCLSYPHFGVPFGKYTLYNGVAVFIASFFWWFIIPIEILEWALSELWKKLFKRIP